MLEGHGYSNVKADKGFMRELKSLDKRLDCFFNAEDEIFVITYERPFGDPVPIAKCAGRDKDTGIFRRPDRRDIEFVASGDLSKKDINSKLAESSYYMEKYREKRRETVRDEIRQRTIEDRRSLMSRFQRAAGSGKANADFSKKSFQKLDIGRKIVSGYGNKPTDVFSNE